MNMKAFILLCMSLGFVGCASQQDFDTLSVRVDGLVVKTTKTQEELEQATKKSAEAAVLAKQAKETAIQTIKIHDEINKIIQEQIK